MHIDIRIPFKFNVNYKWKKRDYDIKDDIFFHKKPLKYYTVYIV